MQVSTEFPKVSMDLVELKSLFTSNVLFCNNFQKSVECSKSLHKSPKASEVFSHYLSGFKSSPKLPTRFSKSIYKSSKVSTSLQTDQICFSTHSATLSRRTKWQSGFTRGCVAVRSSSSRPSRRAVPLLPQSHCYFATCQLRGTHIFMLIFRVFYAQITPLVHVSAPSPFTSSGA